MADSDLTLVDGNTMIFVTKVLCKPGTTSGHSVLEGYQGDLHLRVYQVATKSSRAIDCVRMD
jgi:hypothetical protein